MATQKRTSNEKSRKAAVQTNENRRGFIRKAVLGTVGAGIGVETLAKLTGCVDKTYITNNYYWPDGGPEPDMQKPDSQLPDTLKPDACAPVSTSLTCSPDPNHVVASGTLDAGKSLEIKGGNGLRPTYMLVLDDLDVRNNSVYALVSITDSCGTVLDRAKIAEREVKPMDVSVPMGEAIPDRLEVTVEEIGAGYRYGASWAKFSVRSPCDTRPKQCTPDTTALTCSDTSFLVSAVVEQNYSLQTGSYKVQLDGLIPATKEAAISVLDSCGNELFKEKIAEGDTKPLIVNGQQVEITVDQVTADYTFGAKWAKLSVKVPCTNVYWCPSLMGILDQGQSVTLSNLEFQLDDLMQAGGKVYALISVNDVNGNALTKLKIEEGKSDTFMDYKVEVQVAALGYTFGAKWAKIQVYTKFTEPCGSP